MFSAECVSVERKIVQVQKPFISLTGFLLSPHSSHDQTRLRSETSLRGDHWNCYASYTEMGIFCAVIKKDVVALSSSSEKRLGKLSSCAFVSIVLNIFIYLGKNSRPLEWGYILTTHRKPLVDVFGMCDLYRW